MNGDEIGVFGGHLGEAQDRSSMGKMRSSSSSSYDPDRIRKEGDENMVPATDVLRFVATRCRHGGSVHGNVYIHSKH